jgi:hypothetical protein
VLIKYIPSLFRNLYFRLIYQIYKTLIEYFYARVKKPSPIVILGKHEWKTLALSDKRKTLASIVIVCKHE